MSKKISRFSILDRSYSIIFSILQDINIFVPEKSLLQVQANKTLQ